MSVVELDDPTFNWAAMGDAYKNDRTTFEAAARKECARVLADLCARAPYAGALEGNDDIPVEAGRIRVDVDAGLRPADAGKRLGSQVALLLWDTVRAAIPLARPATGLNAERADAVADQQVLAAIRQGQVDRQREAKELERLIAKAEDGTQALVFRKRLQEIMREDRASLYLTNSGFVKQLNDNEKGVGYSLGCKVTDYMNDRARALAKQLEKELTDRKELFELLVINFKNIAVASSVAPETFERKFAEPVRKELIGFLTGEASDPTSKLVAPILMAHIAPDAPPEVAKSRIAAWVHGTLTVGYAKGSGADVLANSAAIDARESAKKGGPNQEQFGAEIYTRSAAALKEKLREAYRKASSAAQGKDLSGYFASIQPPIPAFHVVDLVRKHYGKGPYTTDPVILAMEQPVYDGIQIANCLDFPLISMPKEQRMVESAETIAKQLARGRSATVSPEESRTEILAALSRYYDELQNRDNGNSLGEQKQLLSRAGFLRELSRPEMRERFKEPIIGTVDVAGLGSINVSKMMQVLHEEQYAPGTSATTAQLAQGSDRAMQPGTDLKQVMLEEIVRFLDTHVGHDDYKLHMSGGDEFFYVTNAAGGRSLSKLEPDVKSAVMARLNAPGSKLDPLIGKAGLRNAWMKIDPKIFGADIGAVDLERANRYLDSALGEIKKREIGKDNESFLNSAAITEIFADDDARICARLHFEWTDGRADDQIVVLHGGTTA